MKNTYLSDLILNHKELETCDNSYMYNHFFNMLLLIVTNRFKWKNLPKGVDSDFVEKTLAFEGEIALINHPLYGFVFTHCVGDNVNLYERPTSYLCFTSNNEISEVYPTDDIVILRNNNFSMPSIDFIKRYAENIANISKTKEININAQKTPLLLLCPKEQEISLQLLYEQYSSGAPVIKGNKNLRNIIEGGFQVLNTQAPYLADKLQEAKNDELTECMKFMGISCTPDKKERLVSEEMQEFNSFSNICLNIFIDSREEFKNKVNEKFGLNIDFDLADYCKTKYQENVSLETSKEVN